ncbi:unnamed protein product [Durusdinium trenchii]|uniref:snRNA-activating protein complex subunit 3 n=1 Tax=Durusdinium trenchii TaxID=1381693 RepID=A0ABP0HCJ5_9DINO
MAPKKFSQAAIARLSQANLCLALDEWGVEQQEQIQEEIEEELDQKPPLPPPTEPPEPEQLEVMARAVTNLEELLCETGIMSKQKAASSLCDHALSSKYALASWKHIGLEAGRAWDRDKLFVQRKDELFVSRRDQAHATPSKRRASKAIEMLDTVSPKRSKCECGAWVASIHRLCHSCGKTNVNFSEDDAKVHQTGHRKGWQKSVAETEVAELSQKDQKLLSQVDNLMKELRRRSDESKDDADVGPGVDPAPDAEEFCSDTEWDLNTDSDSGTQGGSGAAAVGQAAGNVRDSSIVLRMAVVQANSDGFCQGIWLLSPVERAALEFLKLDDLLQGENSSKADSEHSLSKAEDCERLCRQAAKLLIVKRDKTSNKAALGLITFRFLNPAGPFREHFALWSRGGPMHNVMFDELFAYSTALLSMQRLEGRHSILKRQLDCRNFQLPGSLSAAMRRKQNQDLVNPEFVRDLPEFLAAIGELHDGSWGCKTELMDAFLQSSANANHDPMEFEKADKARFAESLAQVCAAGASGGGGGDGEGLNEELPMQREHVKAAFKRGSVYALKGCMRQGEWSVFRVLHTSPSSNMYLQRACHMSFDAWKNCVAIELFSGPAIPLTDGAQDSPPDAFEVQRQSVTALNIADLFCKTCDLHNLYEYTVPWPWPKKSLSSNTISCYSCYLFFLTSRRDPSPQPTNIGRRSSRVRISLK